MASIKYPQTQKQILEIIKQWPTRATFFCDDDRNVIVDAVKALIKQLPPDLGTPEIHNTVNESITLEWRRPEAVLTVSVDRRWRLICCYSHGKNSEIAVAGVNKNEFPAILRLINDYQNIKIVTESV